MGDESSDFIGLIRAVGISLGAGMVVAALAGIITKSSKGVLTMLGAGVTLILTVVLFLQWPSTMEVPDLGGLARAEAEIALEQRGLVAEPRPQYHAATERGRVIAGSQEPRPGISVRRGTVVRFGVAVGSGSQEGRGEGPSVSLFRPKSNEAVRCRRYADDIYHFSVVGTSSGLAGKFKLLLWVKPVEPPSETPGWYLQRAPVNGISKGDITKSCG